MLSFKNIFFLVFATGVSFGCFAQKTEQINTKFWEAVDLNNDKAIVENGEKIIDYIEK